MALLHITKVAVGCSSVDLLADRLDARAERGESTVHTRYRPKRAAELIGGSLFWIIRHQLVARSEILGFEDADEGRRTIIRVASPLVVVRAQPRRAHQGWRYLAGADAPADLDAAEAEARAALPTALAQELAALALI
jgi:hypothetical protein